MKRIAWGIIVSIIGMVSLPQVTFADANNFTFSSFHADYYLGADAEGRSTLKTVETLVAEFPYSDQNHGIERAIPKKYDGHTTSLKIASVTNQSGAAIHYTTYDDSNNNLIVRIGDANSYVHGEKSYTITYTQRDVTKYFANVGDHEFYWDTNGTQWPQSFEKVTATVHISDALTPTFTKKIACYQGIEGATDRCAISTDGKTVTASASNLSAYENMTIAVGFTAGTFRGYQPSVWEQILNVWIIIFVITSIVGFIAIFWLSYLYTRYSNRTTELPPIPTEYIPPKDTSVLLAAQIGDGTRAEVTAQIIDLAVRHYITITQTKEKTLWGQAEYSLEIIKAVNSLSPEEQDFIQTVFSATAKGTVVATKSFKNNYSLASQLQQNAKVLRELVKSLYELRDKDLQVSAKFRRIGHILLLISLVSVSPLLFIAAVVAYGCGWVITPLTDKGLVLRRYLAGLKTYIEYAEKDRIKALQSPEGAEKTGLAIKDDQDAKLVRLYERVLPYAVLFGQEKEWNKQLAIRYEQTGQAPNWYVGQSAFNAAVFTSAMSDFTGSMNSYGAATSSSSGGSSGGGSSGGGGGGGGGGGW